MGAEFRHLVKGAGLTVAHLQMTNASRISPATYLGKGAVEELAQRIETLEVEVAVFNNALTPVQQRNLERALHVKVVDRTGLILEIFAARARTREGCLQVQLASLLYQQSRLVRTWTHLERQRGGVGLRGGPGERQIEVDRRLIRERVHKLKKELTQVERTRHLHRQARRDVPFYTVALVGYTNAGKSTLFNRLTQAKVEVADKLFATLDPTMRLVNLPAGTRIILSDTVGFIRDLPHQLVAAFRSTLEEVLDADLLLHVVDRSDPDWEGHIRAVEGVLEELDAQAKPMLTVYNKMDHLGEKTGPKADETTAPKSAEDGDPKRDDDGSSDEARKVTPENGLEPDPIPPPLPSSGLALSALTGFGMPQLLEELERAATRDGRTFQLDVPVTEGAFLSALHRDGRILDQQEEGEILHLLVTLPKVAAGRLGKKLKKFQATS
ncbi:MAG: GTPase HflX [Magnetococcales bacterium]|nr:GTPase HflX [Magnetococcales bacterium]